MKQSPILFSGDMVRAILDGRKTQTRRIIKSRHDDGMIVGPADESFHALESWGGGKAFRATHIECLPCPFGQPGDRLWVREAFQAQAHSIDDLIIRYVATPKAYSAHGAADGSVPDDSMNVYFRMLDKSENQNSKPIGYPSIHMPRWASRITLEITGVRVERLRSISEADAKAEGIQSRMAVLGNCRMDASTVYSVGVNYDSLSARGSYELLWEDINGADSWTQNPWVWVIEFRRAA